MSVVQLGLAAIVGLVGVVVGQSLKLDLAVSLLIGIAAAGAGFLGAGALVQTGAAPVAASTKKPAKKEKSAAEKKPKKETKAKKQPQPEPEEEEEEPQKPASEKPKKKKKAAKDEPAAAPAPAPAAGKKGKAAPAPVKVESEEEEEEEVQEAPKSKSALKKAKAKAAAAKKEAEERAAAEAAAKAKKEAEERAAAEAAAAGAGKKKKKKAAAEEAPVAKPTKPTKEEKANLEEGDWEIPSHTKRSKKQEEAKAAKLAEKKAKESQPVVTDEKSNKTTAEIKVDVKQLGALIGTGGATLKLIQESTNTKIEVPKKDSGSSLVKITGDNIEDVQRARATIESLLTRGYSSITHPGEIQDDIHIPPDQIGAVVGKGGEILKDLQKATGTTIKMPEKTSTTSRATITGPKEQVKQAKQAIKSLLADGFSPLTHPGWEKVELAFPKEKIGVLIGTKGQTIKSIQGNTKTRINIPDKNSPDQNVSVVGTEAGIRQAVKEINRLLEPVGGYAPEDEDWVQDEVEAEGTWGFKSTAVQGEEALWD